MSWLDLRNCSILMLKMLAITTCGNPSIQSRVNDLKDSESSNSEDSYSLEAHDISTFNISSHQNPNITADINNDGTVSPLDALTVNNRLRAQAGVPGTGVGTPLDQTVGTIYSSPSNPNPATILYLDADGSKSLSANDAMTVISETSARSTLMRAPQPSPHATDDINRVDFDLVNLGSPDPAVSLNRRGDHLIRINGVYQPDWVSVFKTTSSENDAKPEMDRGDRGEIKIAYPVVGDTLEKCIASDKLSTSPRMPAIEPFSNMCRNIRGVYQNVPVESKMIQSQPRFLSIGEQYQAPAPNSPKVCIVARTFACVVRTVPAQGMTRNHVNISMLPNYNTQRYWHKRSNPEPTKREIPVVPMASATPTLRSFDLRPIDPYNPTIRLPTAMFSSDMIKTIHSKLTTDYSNKAAGASSVASDLSFVAFTSLTGPGNGSPGVYPAGNRIIGAQIEPWKNTVPSSSGWIVQREDVSSNSPTKYSTHSLIRTSPLVMTESLRSSPASAARVTNFNIDYRVFYANSATVTPSPTTPKRPPTDPAFIPLECPEGGSPVRTIPITTLSSTTALNTKDESTKKADILSRVTSTERSLYATCHSAALSSRTMENPFTQVTSVITYGEHRAGESLMAKSATRCCVKYQNSARKLSITVPLGAGRVTSSQFMGSDGQLKMFNCAAGSTCSQLLHKDVTTLSLTAVPPVGKGFSRWDSKSSMTMGNEDLRRTITLHGVMFGNRENLEITPVLYDVHTNPIPLGQVYREVFNSRPGSNDPDIVTLSLNQAGSCEGKGGTFPGAFAQLNSLTSAMPSRISAERWSAMTNSCLSDPNCSKYYQTTVVSTTQHLGGIVCTAASNSNTDSCSVGSAFGTMKADTNSCASDDTPIAPGKCYLRCNYSAEVPTQCPEGQPTTGLSRVECEDPQAKCSAFCSPKAKGVVGGTCDFYNSQVKDRPEWHCYLPPDEPTCTAPSFKVPGIRQCHRCDARIAGRSQDSQGKPSCNCYEFYHEYRVGPNGLGYCACPEGDPNCLDKKCPPNEFWHTLNNRCQTRSVRCEDGAFERNGLCVCLSPRTYTPLYQKCCDSIQTVGSLQFCRKCDRNGNCNDELLK